MSDEPAREAVRRWQDETRAAFERTRELNRRALASGLDDAGWAERADLNEATGRALADLLREASPMARRSSKAGSQGLLFADAEASADRAEAERRLAAFVGEDLDEPAGPDAPGWPASLAPAAILASPEKAELVAAISAAQEECIREVGGAPPAEFMAKVRSKSPSVVPSAAAQELPAGELGDAYREIFARREVAGPEVHDRLDRAWTLNNTLLVGIARAVAFIDAGQYQTAKAVLAEARERVEGKREVRTISAEIFAAGDIWLAEPNEVASNTEAVDRAVVLRFATQADVKEFLRTRGPIAAMWASEREG